ncbi:MAG: hypothetical protein C5S47_03350 [Candidatus Methanogasteraceae archaeon]|nr:MAG: hypothetical protein C5S47_03350 [ANME-2 cluster archaeon]
MLSRQARHRLPDCGNWAQPKIPVKYTRGLLFFAPSRLCTFALLFSNLTQGRKGAETRRVLSISVFTSFALLYIQLIITKITGFPGSAGNWLQRG